VARQLLNYHAEMAQASSLRIARLLGIRDFVMADNLEYTVAQERGRGKVLAFAHNSHLQRSMTEWQLGDQLLAWWPAGAQLTELLGPRYAVIGTAVGVSDSQGIGPPEADTLEARLGAIQRPGLFIPTQRGRGLPQASIDSLPTRSGSKTNSTYFPLTPKSLANFVGLAVLNSMA
jgi:erythromycin esterase